QLSPFIRARERPVPHPCLNIAEATFVSGRSTVCNVVDPIDREFAKDGETWSQCDFQVRAQLPEIDIVTISATVWSGTTPLEREWIKHSSAIRLVCSTVVIVSHSKTACDHR